ncbi:MAG: magnesium-translocating P-type ATPase [Lachnospiraceae bacterium]
MKKRSLHAGAATQMVNQRLCAAATGDCKKIFTEYGTTNKGFNQEQVEQMRKQYGENTISHQKNDSLFKRIMEAFVNPFTLVLFALAFISFMTDVVAVSAKERDFTSVMIVMTMVSLSGMLRFIQETRSNHSAEKLTEMVTTTIAVQREPMGKIELPLSEVVTGDLVYLAAGDMIPADVRILKAKDLFVSQSSLTGESEPLEKYAVTLDRISQNPMDYSNLAFMGSNVVSGSALCIVVAVGDDTMFGSMAGSIMEKRTETNFEKGVHATSMLLIRFMMCMTPIVLFINGFTKGDWLQAFLFALSVAVGLTPEMLPMIVTTNLAKGAVNMAKKKTVIKNLNSIQNFGAMNILCTDKTGTLTQDKVVLEYHLDIHGREDERVLRHGFLNSYHQTGLKNLMDVAILNHGNEKAMRDLGKKYHKVDEIPFDFNRRRMSVVVADEHGKTQMITKGAVEEMLAVSSFVEYEGNIELLTEEIRQEILTTVQNLNGEGMRVIAVAQKNNPSTVDVFSVEDEANLVLMGYLAFLDPPKETTQAAIQALGEYGVTTKVLTGDNDAVTRCVCEKVGIQADHLLLGEEIAEMSETALEQAVEQTNVFAKLTPQQKVRIVSALRRNGHTVGFMGDGINDAAAMKESDVGISVDTAVDIAKESADIILLEKDLMILERGVLEGRRTFGNIIKYIKMTASSNFGNMLSVVAASAFLPFLPMLPIQILILNLIYDSSCISIPWDNMDEEYLKKPRKWDASSIGKFMLWIGPASSVFDLLTYLVLFFVICPGVCGGAYREPGCNKMLFMAVFHAGWFVESLWSQILVIHMIRTPKIPFFQSCASSLVLVITTLAITLGTIVTYTVTALPLGFFLWLAVVVVAYMVLVTFLKKEYIRRYGELL